MSANANTATAAMSATTTTKKSTYAQSLGIEEIDEVEGQGEGGLDTLIREADEVVVKSGLSAAGLVAVAAFTAVFHLWILPPLLLAGSLGAAAPGAAIIVNRQKLKNNVLAVTRAQREAEEKAERDHDLATLAGEAAMQGRLATLAGAAAVQGQPLAEQ